MTLDFDIRKSFVIKILNHSKKLDFGSLTKLFFSSVIIIFLGTSFSEAAKKKKDEKDCQYCEKYETLADWPESERPAAFIWEDIDYPEGMFLPTSDTPKKKQGEAVTGDINNYLTLHRAKLHFGQIGLYKTILSRTGKTDYEQLHESTPADEYEVSDAPYLEEYIKTIPVYEKNKNVDVTLKSSHPAPATLRALAWEGDFSPMFYRRA